MYSVVESQRAVIQVPCVRAHTHKPRTRGNACLGGMEDRDWRIETRLENRGWWGRGTRMAGFWCVQWPRPSRILDPRKHSEAQRSTAQGSAGQGQAQAGRCCPASRQFMTRSQACAASRSTSRFVLVWQLLAPRSLCRCACCCRPGWSLPLQCALLTSTPPEFQEQNSTATLTPMIVGQRCWALGLGGRPATSTCAQPDDLKPCVANREADPTGGF